MVEPWLAHAWTQRQIPDMKNPAGSLPRGFFEPHPSALDRGSTTRPTFAEGRVSRLTLAEGYAGLTLAEGYAGLTLSEGYAGLTLAEGYAANLSDR